MSGVRITNGPLARWPLPVASALPFGSSELPLTLLMTVIGGPASPMKMPSPKQAKNARKTVANSRLFIEYSRMCTDRSHRSSFSLPPCVHRSRVATRMNTNS
uniref:Uncharacterized protein n=1 Tax=Anopheles atroparvus TaxID=41427 RepID=A0A182ITZ6_ANOAO